jgi:AraC-like DNA-binding protein
MDDSTMEKCYSIKAHGFTGQRMVVVPKPVWNRMETHRLLQGLRVTDAGFFPKASGHSVHRSKGAPTHLLIACLEGEGIVFTGQKKLGAKPGSIFWLSPDTPHYYEASVKDPWSILWVHFTGEEAPAWRALLFDGGESDGCHVPADQIGSLSLDRIHSILENGYSLLNLVDATSALRFSLGMLIRIREQPGSTRSARLRVAVSAEKLRSDWRHLHRIEELAIQAGVSVSHFSTLFKKETGHAPIDFLIRQKIQHAARLLATTQETIVSISAAVGYEDPFYFSRSFRKIMGCSPRNYRTQSRS